MREIVHKQRNTQTSTDVRRERGVQHLTEWRKRESEREREREKIYCTVAKKEGPLSTYREHNNQR